MNKGIFLVVVLLFIQCKPDAELSEKLYADNIERSGLEESDYPIQGYPSNWPWRGINIKSNDTARVTEANIKSFKKLGINAVRLMVNARDFSIKQHVDIEEGVAQNLFWCEQVIKWCSNEGMVVIIESIDFPLDPSKSFTRRSSRFWNSETELSIALDYIGKLVSTFDKYENVVAYDFFSEPVVLEGNNSYLPENWFEFFHRVLATIREHSDKYVVYTPGEWGLPEGFTNATEPMDDEHIIYGFHYYNPHGFTHQGFGKREGPESDYPGFIGLKYWDRTTVDEEISRVANWGKKHNKLIYVGEFGVVRWADGKDQYLEDVLTSFEANDMSYTYWNFNGWKGWDMDYEESKKGNKKLVRSPEKTKTRQILEKYWQRNN
jgi:hypothetical protein